MKIIQVMIKLTKLNLKKIAPQKLDAKIIFFSDSVNFGFGIEKHIHLGIKYDTYTIIFGIDFYVALKKTGKRVSQRRRFKNRVGFSQRLLREDALQFFKSKYDGLILNSIKITILIIIL